MVDGRILHPTAELFRTLGHPARVRILEVLGAGERPVAELTELIGLERARLSEHLGVLRRAGMVRSRRDGVSVFYAVGSGAVVDLLAAARWVLHDVLAERTGVLANLAASARASERMPGRAADRPVRGAACPPRPVERPCR